jgi:hypothetical protein
METAVEKTQGPVELIVAGHSYFKESEKTSKRQRNPRPAQRTMATGIGTPV